MTFPEAINSIVPNSTTRNAAKRSSWAGYVEAESIDATTYRLTFINRNDVQYIYTWNGQTWVAPQTTVPFDAEFLAGMLADDWIVGTSVAFEAARDGTGVW